MLNSGILLNASSFAEIHLNSNFVNAAVSCLASASDNLKKT